LINPNNHRLILCDFGSAKIIENQEKSISYICSRYYRAPELILGLERYGQFIDVWSVGCVIAEMINGSPFFPGNSNKDQLAKIIKILGTPKQSDYQNVSLKSVPLFQHKHNSKLAEFLKSDDPLLLDLLAKVFDYNPKKRITAIQAMKHEYFDELRQKPIEIDGSNIVDLFDFSEEEIKGHEEEYANLVPNWYKEQAQDD